MGGIDGFMQLGKKREEVESREWADGLENSNRGPSTNVPRKRKRRL